MAHKNIDRAEIKRADIVADIIKDRSYLYFYTTDSIEHIVHNMQKQHQGAVGIVDGTRRFIGLITERDILRKLFGSEEESDASYQSRQQQLSIYPKELTAWDVVIPNPACLTPDTPIEDALEIIKERGFRFMPVITPVIKPNAKNAKKEQTGKELVGIVSERELFWHTQEKIQRQLRDKDTFLSYFMGHEAYGLCQINN